MVPCFAPARFTRNWEEWPHHPHINYVSDLNWGNGNAFLRAPRRCRSERRGRGRPCAVGGAFRRAAPRPEREKGAPEGTPCGETVEAGRLLRSADAADGGTAVGALALGDRLAVLGRALDGVLHDLLFLALDAISFDSHLKYPFPFYGGPPHTFFFLSRDRKGEPPMPQAHGGLLYALPFDLPKEFLHY